MMWCCMACDCDFVIVRVMSSLFNVLCVCVFWDCELLCDDAWFVCWLLLFL